MKKFALLVAVAFCFPVLGLTGCGGGGETEVIEGTPEAPVVEGASEEDYNAAMEAEMNEQGN